MQEVGFIMQAGLVWISGVPCFCCFKCIFWDKLGDWQFEMSEPLLPQKSQRKKTPENEGSQVEDCLIS